MIPGAALPTPSGDPSQRPDMTSLARELIAGLRAFAIPMRTPFRGITVREGALIRGPAGWAEFSPFAEYGPEGERTLAGLRHRGGDCRVAAAGA